MSSFLEQSFVHLPGISRKVELQLWEEGYENWDLLLQNLKGAPIGTSPTGMVKDHLERSKLAIESGDLSFLRKALGQKESWRAYDFFQKERVFLDIETDGGNQGSSITIIGMYDGLEFSALVRDENFHEFHSKMERSKLIISFFGERFDVPMLQKKFTDYPFSQIHFDLCPALKSLGFHGGLKKVEKALGISRPGETDGLSGYDAIRLWNKFYYNDDKRALNLLIEYNKEDVVNLEFLAQFTFDKLKEQAILGKDLVLTKN